MSKVFLCQTDFIVRVVELMENKTTNNSDVLLRQMSLFLVSLVVKEEDPSALFSYKDMFILKKAIDWLCDEYRNEQLYVASAVVIANYLRNGKYLKEPNKRCSTLSLKQKTVKSKIQIASKE